MRPNCDILGCRLPVRCTQQLDRHACRRKLMQWSPIRRSSSKVSMGTRRSRFIAARRACLQCMRNTLSLTDVRRVRMSSRRCADVEYGCPPEREAKSSSNGRPRLACTLSQADLLLAKAINHEFGAEPQRRSRPQIPWRSSGSPYRKRSDRCSAARYVSATPRHRLHARVAMSL